MLDIQRNDIFEAYVDINKNQSDLVKLSLEYEELLCEFDNTIYITESSDEPKKNILKKLISKLKNILYSIQKRIENVFANAAFKKIKSDVNDTVVNVRKDILKKIDNFIKGVKSFLKNPIKFCKSHPQTSLVAVGLVSLGALNLARKVDQKNKGYPIRTSKIKSRMTELKNQIDESDKAIKYCEEYSEFLIREMNQRKDITDESIIKKAISENNTKILNNRNIKNASKSSLDDLDKYSSLCKYALYLLHKVLMNLNKCFMSLASVINKKKEDV